VKRPYLIAACATLAALAPCAFAGSEAIAGPASTVGSVRVEGPVTGGKQGRPFATSAVDLKPYGYSESEYFVSGQAHPFAPAPGTTLGVDGRWTVTAGAAVPYKTRILVRKPPAAKFNGTVIVEFMQEYYGTERDTNYRWNAETILRQGFGWVGVSLHHEGINSAKPPQTITMGGQTVTLGTTLARWDPERYGSLNVPSSDLSYDILSQVGRAVGPNRPSGGVDPLDGLKVRKVIAVGNTIAGHRLGIYINAVQPVAQVFDGFFLQDFTKSQLQLSSGVSTATGVIRIDTKVPVIVLQTTTAAAKEGPKPEGRMIRYWDPAGSSHTTGAFMARVADADARDLGIKAAFCPIEKANSLPVQYVSGAALVALHRWANGGSAAPPFPQLPLYEGPKEPVPEPKDYFDAHGNVAGGLRTPWVDVPIARYDWRGDCPAGSGLTFRFTADQLKALYGTPDNYRRRFAVAVRDAQRRGVLLREDAEDAIRQSRAVAW
jgi:hypothetical protein